MDSYVPDFELDPSSPRGENRNAIYRGDEDIMELLWKNGQVVTQTQNQRSLKKLTDDAAGYAEIPFLQPSSHAREIPSVDAEPLSRQQHQQQQLLIPEDEMASWLQYPLDDLDREIYSDILYSTLSPPTSPHRETRSGVTTELRPQPSVPPPAPSTSIAALPPTIGPPPRGPPQSVAAQPTICTHVEIAAPPKLQNFLNFSRVARVPSSSMKTPRESTRVDSNETPTAGQESRLTPAAGSSAQLSGPDHGGTSAACTSPGGKDFASTCGLTVTASPGGSGASVSASVEATPPVHKQTLSTAEERKRKDREPDDTDYQSDDDDIGSGEVKKQSHKSTSVKRSRAAEVHNMSERRRRDRINEKMKALQELIPRCNKVDKASMLDEAIEYLKSLQLQVQMMSMGCGMVPMMYPGAQQYMAAMGMGMGMGMMGMGMDVGMNQPVMPYPTQFPGSGFPLQAAANLAPRFPMPPFPLQPVHVPITARTTASLQPYPGLNSLAVQGPNQPRLSTPVDPYQHLTAFQQAQVPIHSYVQNQVVVQASTYNPSNNGDAVNPESKKTG